MRVMLAYRFEEWLNSGRLEECAEQFLDGDILNVHMSLKFVANDVRLVRALLGMNTPDEIVRKAKQIEWERDGAVVP